MKLKYNAPITLTFSIICAAVLAVNQFFLPEMITTLFTAEGRMTFAINSIPSFIRVLTHIFGHANWEHLMSNLMLILLLGPFLEEKYGGPTLVWMIFITALINGLVNGLFFTSELLGSSGVAFMMILLASFVNIKEGEIPLTFLLVFFLYIFKEVRNFLNHDEISQISHIIGGICGSIFGFTKTVIRMNKKVASPPPAGGGVTGNQTVIG